MARAFREVSDGSSVRDLRLAAIGLTDDLWAQPVDVKHVDVSEELGATEECEVLLDRAGEVAVNVVKRTGRGHVQYRDTAWTRFRNILGVARPGVDTRRTAVTVLANRRSPLAWHWRG